ncbi:MAG: MJ1255/VC2487 family glycosyltransferase [Spongiibacteraceae bacterium]
MKILYGVQATGNGHISRARMIARYFTEQNRSDIEVTFLFSGRSPEKFFDMECFGNCLYRRGLTFSTRAGKVSYLKTIRENNLVEFIKEVSSLKVDDYDLIITDFEPITAWAAKLTRQKVIGIGHQYAFGHNIPVAGKTLLAAVIMRHFAPATTAVGLHWHHFDKAILPPIIDENLHATHNNDSVVVYLPFEDQAVVSQLLNSLSQYHFIQYSPELNDAEQGNISLRKTCHSGFKQDLSRSSAVICNAGFELVSECLQLQTPVLVKPLQGQFEQLSNAQALRQLGYASVLESLDRDCIETWLQGNKKTPGIRFNNVAKALVEWLSTGQTDDIGLLARRLWG